MAVAAADAAVLVEVVVALGVDLVIRAGVNALVEPVVRIGERGARLIRQWDSKPAPSRPTDPSCAFGNLVAREGPSFDIAGRIRERVKRVVYGHQLAGRVERLREVACALQCQWAAIVSCVVGLSSVVYSYPPKKNVLLLDNGTADDATVLIAMVDGVARDSRGWRTSRSRSESESRRK